MSRLTPADEENPATTEVAVEPAVTKPSKEPLEALVVDEPIEKTTAGSEAPAETAAAAEASDADDAEEEPTVAAIEGGAAAADAGADAGELKCLRPRGRCSLSSRLPSSLHVEVIFLMLVVARGAGPALFGSYRFCGHG